MTNQTAEEDKEVKGIEPNRLDLSFSGRSTTIKWPWVMKWSRKDERSNDWMVVTHLCVVPQLDLLLITLVVQHNPHSMLGTSCYLFVSDKGMNGVKQILGKSPPPSLLKFYLAYLLLQETSLCDASDKGD